MSLTTSLTLSPLRKDPDGVLRVGATRVTLDSVVAAFCEGASAEEIACRYPALALPEVYATLTYYLERKGEIDLYLAAQEAVAEGYRREVQAQFPSAGVRDRLLARKSP